MCGMKAQRQAEVVAAVAAQPMSAHALLRGTAEERLTNGVHYANVAGMNKQERKSRGGGGALLSSLGM